MPVLLCSMSREIRNRWQDLLVGENVLHAATVSELKRLVLDNDISLILLHRSMVTIETMVEIRQAVPLCKIFLFSDRPDEDEGFTYLKQGIVGYANTYISPTRLNEAIRVVLSGSVWVGQAVMQRLIRETVARAEEIAATKVSHHKLKSLTPREHEIAEMVAKGQSNLEIAYNLSIAERTVKAHLSSIYVKTGAGNRLNLALMIN
jgi:two-component system, NarL family, nitrate/nitrite response regulator NarL